MTNRMKWIIGITGAATLTAFLARPAEVEVEIGRVQRGPLSVTVADQGQTRPIGRYAVTAPIPGRVSRTLVHEGTQVQAGDTLLFMVPPPEDPRLQAAARAAVSASETRRLQALAGVTEATRNHEQAQKEVDRRRPLRELGALGSETMERFERSAETTLSRIAPAQAALRAADADVAATKRALASARGASSQSRTAVAAPASGIVHSVFEESQRVVPAGTPLFEIASNEGLEVVVGLRTEQAVKVSPGDSMLVSGWGGGTTLMAFVRRVSPAAYTEISALGVEEQRVNVIGGFEDPESRLGSGYRVEVAIVVWHDANVLTVPNSAIFQLNGDWNVFLLDRGKARLRVLGVGQRGSQRSQVLAGLEENDRVVLFPSDLINDGVRVKVTTPTD